MRRQCLYSRLRRPSPPVEWRPSFREKFRILTTEPLTSGSWSSCDESPLFFRREPFRFSLFSDLCNSEYSEFTSSVGRASGKRLDHSAPKRFASFWRVSFIICQGVSVFFESRRDKPGTGVLAVEWKGLFFRIRPVSSKSIRRRLAGRFVGIFCHSLSSLAVSFRRRSHDDVPIHVGRELMRVVGNRE